MVKQVCPELAESLPTNGSGGQDGFVCENIPPLSSNLVEGHHL